MKPDHADAHYQLGMALVNQGKLAEAAPMFEKYLELAPDRPVRRHGEGHPGAASRSRRRHGGPCRCSERSPPASRTVRHRLARALERAGRSPSSRPAGRRLEDPSRSTTCGRPSTRARPSSARTASRRPWRRSAQRPICRSTWHLVGHLQSNKATEGGRGVRVHPLHRQRRSAEPGGRGRGRSRATARSCSSRWTWRASRPSTAPRPRPLALDLRGGGGTAGRRGSPG